MTRRKILSLALGLCGVGFIANAFQKSGGTRPLPLTPACDDGDGAVLDFWQCDGNGVYDNDGFKLRGHLFTDASGNFRVETVKPAPYKLAGRDRAPHIHVKVQGPGTRRLTSQLFFPGEPLNDGDWFLDESLIMQVAKSGGALAARFDFVLA